MFKINLLEKGFQNEPLEKVPKTKNKMKREKINNKLMRN